MLFKLQMKWKIVHLPLVYSLTDSLICPHNALVSHLKLVPGFRACFNKSNMPENCVHIHISVYVYD